MKDICDSLRPDHQEIVFLPMLEQDDLAKQTETAEALKEQLGIDKTPSKTVFLPVQHADESYGLVIRTHLQDHYLGEGDSQAAINLLNKAQTSGASAAAAVKCQAISLPLNDQLSLTELIQAVSDIPANDLATHLQTSYVNAISPPLETSRLSISDLEVGTPKRAHMLQAFTAYSLTREEVPNNDLDASQMSQHHCLPKTLDFSSTGLNEEKLIRNPIANLGQLLTRLFAFLEDDVLNALPEHLPGLRNSYLALLSEKNDMTLREIYSYLTQHTDSPTNIYPNFEKTAAFFWRAIEEYNRLINDIPKTKAAVFFKLGGEIDQCITELQELNETFSASEQTLACFKEQIAALIDALQTLKTRYSPTISHELVQQSFEDTVADLNTTTTTTLPSNHASPLTQAGGLTPRSAEGLRSQSLRSKVENAMLAETAEEEICGLEEQLKEASETIENLRRELERLKATEQENTETRETLEQKLERLNLVLSSQKSSRTTPPNSTEPTPDTAALEALEQERAETQRLQQRLSEMGEELGTLESEKTAYQTTAEELRAEKDTLAAKLETLSRQFADLSEELETKRNEVDERERTLKALQEKLARVESDLTQAQTRTFNDTLGASMMAGNRSMMSQSIAGGLSKNTQKAQMLATQLEPFTTPNTDTQKQAVVAKILKLCGMLTDILDTFDNSITQHVQREERKKAIALLQAELATAEAMTKPAASGLVTKSYDKASMDTYLKALASALSTAKSSMETITKIDQRAEEHAISLNDPLKCLIARAESFLELLTQYNKTLTELKEAKLARRKSDNGHHPLQKFTPEDLASLKSIFKTPHKTPLKTLGPLQAQLNSDSMSLQTFSFQNPMTFLDLEEFLQPPTVNIDLYHSPIVDRAPDWEMVSRAAEIKPDVLYCAIEDGAVTYYFIAPTRQKQKYTLNPEEMQDISLPPPRVLENNPRQFFNSIKSKLLDIAIKHEHISPLVNDTSLYEKITQLCQLITEPTEYRLQKRGEHLKNIQASMSDNFIACLAHMKAVLIPIEQQLKTHVSSCIKNADAARELLALTIRFGIAQKFNLRSDQNMEGPADQYGQKQPHTSPEKTSDAFFKIDTDLVKEVIDLLKKTNTDLQRLSPDRALQEGLEDIEKRLGILEIIRDFIVSDHNSTEDTALKNLKGKLISLINTAPNILSAIAALGAEIESYFNPISNDHSKDESREYCQQYTKLTSNPVLEKMDPQMIVDALSRALDGFVYGNQNLTETLLLELQQLPAPLAAAASQGRRERTDSNGSAKANGGGSGRSTPTLGGQAAHFKLVPVPGSGRSTPTGGAGTANPYAKNG